MQPKTLTDKELVENIFKGNERIEQDLGFFSLSDSMVTF